MKKTSRAVSDDDWQVEHDLRTICAAREIEKDPKRMAKVKELAKRKMTEMASISTSDEAKK